MIAAALIATLLSTVVTPHDCGSLSPDEQAVVTAALEHEFSTPPRVSFPIVVAVLDLTENWLPIDLPESFRAAEAFRAGSAPADAVAPFQLLNTCPPASLSGVPMAFLSYPTDIFASQDQDGDAPACVATRYGLPATVAYVSRPYLSGSSAFIAIGQRHSWNYCGLWYVARLERENGSWQVVTELCLTIW